MSSSLPDVLFPPPLSDFLPQPDPLGNQNTMLVYSQDARNAISTILAQLNMQFPVSYSHLIVFFVKARDPVLSLSFCPTHIHTPTLSLSLSFIPSLLLVLVCAPTPPADTPIPRARCT